MTRRSRILLGVVVFAVAGTSLRMLFSPKAIPASTRAARPDVAPARVAGVVARPRQNAWAAAQYVDPRDGGAVSPAPADRALVERIHLTLRLYLERDTAAAAEGEADFADLIALLNADNVATIARSLSPLERQTSFGTAVLTMWLSTDAPSASAWLAERNDLNLEQASVLGRALLNAPVALEAVSRAMPDGEWKEALLQSAALSAADDDKAKAMTLANRLPAGPAQTGVYETIAYAWAARDAGGLQAWLRGVADEALRQRLLAVGAKAVAATDPDLAAQWLGASDSDSGPWHETAMTVAEAWSAKDPAAAARWIAQLSTATRKPAALLLVRRWIEIDGAATSAWLAQLPEREAILAQLRDEAAERIAAKL